MRVFALMGVQMFYYALLPGTGPVMFVLMASVCLQTHSCENNPTFKHNSGIIVTVQVLCSRVHCTFLFKYITPMCFVRIFCYVVNGTK